MLLANSWVVYCGMRAKSIYIYMLYIYTYYIHIYTYRSSSGLKLIHNFSSNNKVRNFYFNRLARLWNSFPIIDLHLPINTLKGQLKQYLWKHFMNNFNPADPCSLHYLCPCIRCHASSSPVNFTNLNTY